MEEGINPFEETVDPAFAATLTQGADRKNPDRIVYAVSSVKDRNTTEYDNPKDAAKAYMDIPVEDRPDVVRTTYGEEHGPGGVGQVIANTTRSITRDGETIHRNYGSSDEAFNREMENLMRSQTVNAAGEDKTAEARRLAEEFRQSIELAHGARGHYVSGPGVSADSYASMGVEDRSIAYANAETAAKHDKLAAIPKDDIAARREAMLEPVQDLISPVTARKWMETDVAAYNWLNENKDRQEMVGLDMMGNAKLNPAYDAAFRKYAPEVYEASAALYADNEQRIANKEERKAAESGLDGILTRSAQFDAATQERNALENNVAGIADGLAKEGIQSNNLDKTYMENSSAWAGLDVAGFQRLTTEAQRAEALQAMRRNVEQDQGYARALAETAPGIRADVEAVGQDRTALVENSISFDLGNAGGRQATAANDEEAGRIPAGVEAENGPGLFDRLKESFKSWAHTEEDRGKDLDAHLKRTFNVAGNEYHYKDKTNPKESLAFTDLDHTLVTKHDDPKAIEGMLKLAESKGWDKLALKGSDDFKREAWIMASAQGFEVTGYQPSEIDKERMRQTREGLQKNQVGGERKEGGEIAGSAAEGGKTNEDPKVAAYRASAEFGKTVDHVAKTLADAGYPVDEKFKKSIGDHLTSEYAQGRQYTPSKEAERATPVERALNPSDSTTRTKDVEIKAPVYADRSR
jgi:hypothetical protein